MHPSIESLPPTPILARLFFVNRTVQQLYLAATLSRCLTPIAAAPRQVLPASFPVLGPSVSIPSSNVTKTLLVLLHHYSRN